MTVGTTLTQAQRQMVDLLGSIQQRIAELEEQAEGLKGQLRDELGGCQVPVGDRTLSIYPTRRFNPDLAAQVLPAELATLCTSTVIDAKKARQVLPPALYQACQTESEKLSVRLA